MPRSPSASAGAAPTSTPPVQRNDEEHSGGGQEYPRHDHSELLMLELLDPRDRDPDPGDQDHEGRDLGDYQGRVVREREEEAHALGL
jgi:hypothetical protein